MSSGASPGSPAIRDRLVIEGSRCDKHPTIIPKVPRLGRSYTSSVPPLRRYGTDHSFRWPLALAVHASPEWRRFPALEITESRARFDIASGFVVEQYLPTQCLTTSTQWQPRSRNAKLIPYRDK